jgi:transcriptional regulator with XRE-family HTH domain
MASGIEYQVGELLRELRERRGLSVRTMAANAGFSPSFISQVENGQASPSIASLEKLAACLDITLAEFFQAGAARSSAVVRANERPRLESGWSKAEIESLGSGRGSRLEPVLITLRAGGMSGKNPHTLAREQFIFVISGRVTLFLDETESELAAGDAATITAQAPYRFVNSSEQPVQLLVVSSRRL